ncbi:type VI secretion system contractile sheath small subunit [Vibrio sp. SCSIO 43135]|uniref:Type VI secretion system contractile sheath small subunit n=1 Tax=Vibrio paucivorans TaxID=2829489 RepID=A0A9X3CDM1_9VIBR|nr:MULTISPECIES: type VI secretion system contractile sheath small subunit [Vibrio]MCW8333874.1 type VI secretion system contractile sheath small subunit [Vibrio paucivorans]USD43067.1 type VI secretion system contractile sheath small subunit [Vibrio sp. SCSIO 43135]
MSKEGSVAPKERINIKYIPATGDSQAEIELPLKTLIVGDFKGHTEETPVEERETVSVDKNNFESVMRESELKISATVGNKLSDNPEDELPIELNFKSLADFAPDSVAEQVPELKKLIELREALVALKGPLGNIPAFRDRLQDILNSEESREKLLSELNLVSNPEEEPQA